EATDPLVVGDVEVPGLVEERAHPLPAAVVAQQVVALDDDERDRATDRHGAADGELERPVEPRCVRRLLLGGTQPTEQGDEAVDVEGVRRALAVPPAEGDEHLVVEVVAVHPDDDDAVPEPLAEDLAQRRLAGPGGADDAEEGPRAAVGERRGTRDEPLEGDRRRPRSPGTRGHRHVYPPSIGRCAPVIIEAPSLRRNTTGAAISSSVAQRPSGICSRNGGPT